jgi:hypothetical protein
VRWWWRELRLPGWRYRGSSKTVRWPSLTSRSSAASSRATDSPLYGRWGVIRSNEDDPIAQAAAAITRFLVLHRFLGTNPPTPYIRENDPPPVDIRIVPKRQSQVIQLVETGDIGEIVQETLQETSPIMRAFWKFAAIAPNPNKEFALAWTHVADAFAESTARHKAAPFRSVQSRWHHISLAVEAVALLYEAGLYAVKVFLGHNPVVREFAVPAEKRADALHLTALGVYVAGPRAEYWARYGVHGIHDASKGSRCAA